MAHQRPVRPVLVVEDHEDKREMVEMLLKHDGFAVHTAVHGLDAFRCIQRFKPCLILLDVMMPVMDGITFARELRRYSDREVAESPIILLTALSDASEALKETGALDVIHKPIAIDEVINVVGRHCHAISATH
jgi:DNA-binding response OmpR family regulator